MSNLVLKDALSADISFTPIARMPDGIMYERKGATLLGRSRVSLTLTENGKTNRIRGKLTVPVVADCSTTCGEVPVVQYTEVASFDFSIYRAGQETGRSDIAALTASLLSSPEVVAMIVDGSKPTTI